MQSHAHGTAFSLAHNTACAVPMGREMRRVTNTTQLRAPRSAAPLTWPHGPLERGAPQRCHRGMGRGRVFMLISMKTRFLNQASLLSLQLHLLSLQDVPAAPVSQTNISLTTVFLVTLLAGFLRETVRPLSPREALDFTTGAGIVFNTPLCPLFDRKLWFCFTFSWRLK